MSIGLKIFLLIIFLAAASVASYYLYLGICRDHRRHKYQRRKLKDTKRAEFDALIKENIEGEDPKSFAVIFVEFDGAKEFKDNYGEEYYAWALGAIRERIASVLPKGSRVCLYDYDTYAFFMDGEYNQDELAEYAANCINKAHMPIPCGRKRKQKALPDLVVGAAAYDVDDTETTAETFLRNVAVALAVSGRMGTNDFVVYTPELLAQNADYHYYRELKDAINANEFTIYFQPICNLFEGDTIAYEAMLRWNHTEFGSLRPDKFIHVIERSGDINWVGLWAYEQTVIEYKKFLKLHPDSNIKFSINITLLQLEDENVCDELFSIAERYQVPPSGICFEVAEAAILGRNTAIIENIEKLVQCGFLIAVDNFMLEESSVLKIGERRLFDWIKLDKRFTATVQTGEPDIKNMQQLLDFARAGNFLVIAQNINDSMTEEFIKRIGIFCGQGYHLGKPKPFEHYINQAEAVILK